MKNLMLLVCLALSAPMPALALPGQLTQEGLVTDAQGRPFSGRHSIVVRLYAVAQGGAPFFEETHRNVPFVQGYYAVQVGSVVPLNGLDFLRDAVFLGLQIDNAPEATPRTPFTKVPAAFVADVAGNVTGDITPRSVSVGGQVVIDAQGRWRGDPVGLRGPAGPAGGNGSPDTAEQVLAKIKTVDGAASLLDADLLDGLHAAAFLPAVGNARLGGSLAVTQDIAASGQVTAGGVHLNDVAGHAFLTLQRADASAQIGIRYRTGQTTNWWQFVDNDPADADLRWRSPAVAGFTDRAPQLRLTAAGDLAVGRNLSAGGALSATALAARGDVRQGPLVRLRPTAAAAAGQAALLVEGGDGSPRVSLEPQGGGDRGAISGSATGLDVFGGRGNAGALRLRSSHNANGGEINLLGNRIDLRALSAGGAAATYLSVVGPTGRVGVAEEAPAAQLHVTGLRNEIVFRQEREGGVSYDQNIDRRAWILAQSGAAALITADGPNSRVTIPSLVIPASARAPAQPILGQIYNDAGQRALFVWDGTQWVNLQGGGGGNGGGGPVAVPRVIRGFGGVQGPDLSAEGYSQCYGWANDGRTAAPAIATITQGCGAGRDMVFAGHRCDGGYVRHNAMLRAPFRDFLLADRQRFWRDFDVAGRYSWHQSPDWSLLVNFNNGWSDPGRLWEPYVGGVAANVAAAYGHVLSQAGNQAHDQHLCVNDKYYIYLKPPAAQPPEAVPNGLVGHWPLNGDGRDVSNRGLNGVLQGTVNFAAGKSGQAARIDGNDDAIRVVDAGNSPLDVSAVTMAAWVFPQSCVVPNDRGIIMNKESTYEWGLEANTCRLQGAFSPCWRWWGSVVIPTNTWTHVAIVQDGRQEIHYVNGVRREATACPGLLALNNLDFKIGSRGGDGANSSSFNGLLDEAFLYDRALSDAEVNALFASGAVEVAAGALGGVANPASSCLAIKTGDAGATSGFYFLDTDGNGPRAPFMAYCEQALQGGGWTLLNNHEAAAGYFGNVANALSYHTADPGNPLYSILGRVGEFQRNGRYELLYWNRQFDRWIINQQTNSPLQAGLQCGQNNNVVASNYNPGLFCGYTPGPAGWAAINGHGPNWTHAVGQLRIYANWPLVCTHNSGYQCNHYQFYVR